MPELMKKRTKKPYGNNGYQETYGLCKNPINIYTEDFVILKDFQGGYEVKKGFYHKNCYIEAITMKSKKPFFDLLGRVTSLVEKAEKRFED